MIATTADVARHLAALGCRGFFSVGARHEPVTDQHWYRIEAPRCVVLVGVLSDCYRVEVSYRSEWSGLMPEEIHDCSTIQAALNTAADLIKASADLSL